jgi:hypothetical protein
MFKVRDREKSQEVNLMCTWIALAAIKRRLEIYSHIQSKKFEVTNGIIDPEIDPRYSAEDRKGKQLKTIQD